MNCSNLCSIVFKYGGYWADVKGQSRMKYVSGSQKTLKFEICDINLLLLKEQTETLCRWLRGQAYDLHYHINGTSPKVYMQINNNRDVMDMLRCSCNENKVEVVVVVKDFEENTNNVDNIPNADMQDLSEISRVNNGIIMDGLGDGGFVAQIEENQSLCVGSRFEDSTSFKHAIRSNAILQNFGLKIKASDKSRVIATCTYRGCPWRIRASLCSDGHSFEVRKLQDSHLCPGVNRDGNKQATTTWIAHEIKNLVKRNPDITPKDINNNLESTFGLSLPYMKIWRSRESAREQMFGSIDENYSWVPTLKSELIKRNPGSHITYLCDNQNNSFKRFFVSFKICIDGFFAGCRYLIGIDACHLKSKYLGVLLAANCLDGNNGLFTIAFAVAKSESRKTWEWFLMNLAEAFSVDVEHLAFISDMEKGLGEAIKVVFPNAEHRICMRHLWKNIKKLFRCDDSHRLQQLVWSAANCYNQHEFNTKIEEIYRISPELHSYLSSLKCKWSKATFSKHIKNHYNTNNMVESFNSWIEEARNKPVVDLIDIIRGMLMEQRSQRKLHSASWKGSLVPFVEDYIRDVTTRKDHFIIRRSTSTKAEVEGSFERHEVDIENHLCSCGFWQLSGLPCVHGAAFIGTNHHNLWHTYVDEHYYIYRYKMAYDQPIAALPGKEQWCVASDGMHILPPVTLRPRGRPKKRRIKNFLEVGKKSKISHKCGRCNSWGHHRSTCKEPISIEGEDIQTGLCAKIPIRWVEFNDGLN